MDIEFNTRKKLEVILAQIDSLLLSDFPHESSRSALELVKQFFTNQKIRLSRVSDPQTLSRTCTTINERIYEYLPILGFLLRSTNVRNSFEAYDAFVEIARALIGADAQVIMSSEWDFSPLTYPMSVPVLPKHVLLGMPAPESQNALLLPLAGHELGHSVWVNERLENTYAARIQAAARDYLKNHWASFVLANPGSSGPVPNDNKITSDLFLAGVVEEIANLVNTQVEELFCDAIGVHLFGSSYVYAFHYLLAPSLGGARNPDYPPLKARADCLARFSGLDVEDLGFTDYPAEFRQDNPPQNFSLRAADETTSVLAQTMYDDAKDIVTTKAARFTPNEAAEDQIRRLFEASVPASDPSSLADIVNAGWAYMTAKASTHTDERSLIEWTSELALKSIEVLEYRRRVRA